MQIKFKFKNNVRILCLFCNIKKSKTTDKSSENSIVLIVFIGVICDYIISVALHESGTRNALLGSWLNNTEVYLTPFISTQNHIIAG